MRILKSLCLAFSMYSKIPMPNVYWNKENMRYVICFLPLVGAVIGGILMLWFTVCLKLNINNACFAAGIYMKIRTRILFALKLGIMAAVLLLKIQRINRRIKKNG